MGQSHQLKSVLVWRRIYRSQNSELLPDQFSEIDLTRLSMSANPPKLGIQVEIYPRSKTEGLNLIKKFGGKLLNLPPKTWWLPQEPRSEPLSIGNKLLIVATKEQKKYWQTKYPSRKLLIIPASLAFGTGEHATTEMCLKQIAQVNDWPSKSFLDIGTGTGILAITARVLGSFHVDAFDNDKRSIPVARENEEMNFPIIESQISKPVSWKISGIEKLSKKSSYHVIVANLYSELLIKHAKQIAQALKPEGQLFLSGIFEDQIEAVKNAFFKQKLHLIVQKRKGRWWCIHFLN